MKYGFEGVADAIALLKQLGASARLLTHVSLVGEAAEILIEKLKSLRIPFDENFVRLGVVFHDAGKILFQEELATAGKNHEAAGEKLLIASGVAPALARCCLSHGQWQVMDCSFEELLIALADTLWKGRRSSELELRVIDCAAQLLSCDRWDLFGELDSCFEAIAEHGAERLARSQRLA